MTKPIGAGALFPQKAHSRFLDWTRQRYNSMTDRLKRKKPPLAVPFTLDEFRADVWHVMGEQEDAPLMCRYCRMPRVLDDIAVDHAQPLSRGGDLGLGNLDYCCKGCNDMKGSMTPSEFQALLEFLQTPFMALARLDVLLRLRKANALAAGMRRNAALIAEVKAGGNWPSRRKNAAPQSALLDSNSELGDF